ncbi:MAG TPA: aquaporin, partial [Ilumatobacteraceae bacterium]|nr:aquaporin [Ilumatobacteraceae bacterium]
MGAEAFGTTVLMLGGPGTAVLMPDFAGKQLAVALAFGFSLLIMAYVIGPISGCHINPAVTLGMWLTKKVNAAHALFAFVGQVIGAALGGFLIWTIARGVDGWEPGRFASNGYGTAHSP